MAKSFRRPANRKSYMRSIVQTSDRTRIEIAALADHSQNPRAGATSAKATSDD